MKLNIFEGAFWLLLISALTAAVFCGCERIEITSNPQSRVPNPQSSIPNPQSLIPNPYRLLPPMDLPKALRQRNYAGGSCVHAAMIDCLNWQGKHKLAQWWRKMHRGGEGLAGLASKADRAGLNFAYTSSGNAGFLEWVSRTRRGAVIFYYSNHAVTFCGFNRGNAVLINNNHPGRLVRIPKNTFLSRWRSYGGVAFTPVYSPAPPRPWVGGIRNSEFGSGTSDFRLPTPHFSQRRFCYELGKTHCHRGGRGDNGCRGLLADSERG